MGRGVFEVPCCEGFSTLHSLRLSAGHISGNLLLVLCTCSTFGDRMDIGRTGANRVVYILLIWRLCFRPRVASIHTSAAASDISPTI